MNSAVIITGHLGGLGTSLARQFLESGYHVIGIDRNSGEDLPFTQIPFDIAQLIDDDKRVWLQQHLDEELKGFTLNALIHNAAVQHLGSIHEIPVDQFLESLHVNLIAPLVLTRLVLSNLQQTKGTVVNINSIHATQTKSGFAPYSISKAGMGGLTRAMAIELGHLIRVLEIRPAAIATPMLEAGFADKPEAREQLDRYHPTGRIGSPAEIAGTIQELVESTSSFINGSVINIDGGISHVLHDPI